MKRVLRVGEKHAVVNVMTVGDEQGSAIYHISAVIFDLDKEKNDTINFELNVDVKSCTFVGMNFEIDEFIRLVENGTIRRLDENFSIQESLFKLVDLIKTHEVTHIWSYSLKNEIGTLELVMNALNITIPWKQHKLLDVRTLIFINPSLKLNEFDDGLERCLEQVTTIKAIMSSIYEEPKQPDTEA